MSKTTTILAILLGAAVIGVVWLLSKPKPEANPVATNPLAALFNAIPSVVQVFGRPPAAARPPSAADGTYGV